MIKMFFAMILTFLSQQGFPQVCGQGVFSVNFYVPNTEIMDSIIYELVPVTKAQVDSILDRSKMSKFNTEELWDGAFIYSSQADLDSFIKDQKKVTISEAFGNQYVVEGLRNISRDFALGDLTLSGVLKGHSIKFPTIEGNFHLFILKFTEKKKSGYLVANFFGGCNRKVDVFWDETYGFRKCN
jgi:hypothetical protein